MTGRAFIIHLARATARRQHVDQLIMDCPVPAEIVDAVDGGLLSPDERADVYVPRLHRPAYPFTLREAEIGCFLSHRLCWQKIVENDLPYALVFEDDALLDKEIAGKALELAENHIEESGYIQLPVRAIGDNPYVVAQDNGTRLVRPGVVPLRLSGQMISRSAARELLRLTTVFDRPVDTFLQMFWLTGIRPLAVEPSGLTDCTQEAGGSTISRRKPFGERVVREVRRFWYRRAVAIRSARAGARN
ncbi:MAG: glycosyltransferase family 25 protein [Alphaproteobacteria bacterium]|nr:glycosyltransferase family 25 protein [Alphaproteobacteria bacterium]